MIKRLGMERVGRVASMGREEKCNQDLDGKTYKKYATRMWMGGCYDKAPYGKR
jgi:hypothetical protein